MTCPSNKIYNKKTNRCIANTSSNRRRIGVNLTVVELKAEAKKYGLVGYSKLRKAELLKLLQLGEKGPIPKIYHQIWIGNNPLPEYYKLFKSSFKKYLPNFTYKLWREKDIKPTNFPITYKYIQKARKLHGTIHNASGKKYSKYAQIADLMRLEILYHHGGYYFDITFELLKNVATLFGKTTETFVGCNEVTNKNVNYLSNSFIGSVPKHPILQRALSKKNLDKINFYKYKVNWETGPIYLKKHIKHGDDIKIFPTNYFYPYITWDTSDRKKGKDKCLFLRPTKNTTKITLNNREIYLLYPCTKYPRSYANKHWELGGTWV